MKMHWDDTLIETVQTELTGTSLKALSFIINIDYFEKMLGDAY